MIEFDSQNDFKLDNQKEHQEWLSSVAASEDKRIKHINYVFCSDEFLLDINQEHLNHDTYTDIITFDYSVGGLLEGEIYISTDRVRENASQFNAPFDLELNRVMVHGLLHMLGYSDQSDLEKQEMRTLEDLKLQMFHVKQ